ncbi:MAG TPA: TIGR00266 family protein [Ruminococcus sp.]|nr:TIGR00266 family protein [Ruminococcus sp.]
MNFEIKGDTFPVLICNLNEGESMANQQGAMAWMSPNMKMSTNAGNGIGKFFSRAISGESVFQNIYTAEKGNGMIAYSSSFPGTILPIQISSARSIIAQKTAFLASQPTVNFEVFFQKKFGSGFFGGEGFIMQKFTGDGMLFLEIDGSIIEYDLAPNQSILVDTGYLAAADSTISIDIESVKGIGNVLFGGEGLFNTRITGPGHIWLQTMPITQFASSMSKYIVKSNG